MPPRTLLGRRPPPEPPPDPRRDEPWFRALPAPHRERIAQERRADWLHRNELARGERRRLLVEAAQMAAVYAVADLVCPAGDALSVLAALVAGAAVGLLCNRIEAGRLLSICWGFGAFFALQWLGRGGLTGMHLLVFFPQATACAWLGWLREERSAP